jgi:hypothetical protein
MTAPAERIENVTPSDKLARRWRRRWVVIWTVLILVLVVPPLTPVVIYFAWQSHGKKLLQAELARIQASGEPLTTSEMHAAYALPADERDITPIWAQALAPFDTKAYTDATFELPVVGKGDLPPLDQPLSEEQQLQVDSYLQQFGHRIEALHAAAAEEGSVRLPRDFAQGISIDLSDAQQARNASRALKLELNTKLRANDIEGALRCIATKIRMADIYRHDPILIVLLVRMAILGDAFADMRTFAEFATLSEAQLAKLQELLRSQDTHAQLPLAMQGERATIYLCLQNLASYSDGVTVESDHNLQRIQRPEDCAVALRFMTDAKEAANLPFPEALDAVSGFEDRIDALRELPLSQFRFVGTQLLLPATSAMFLADARTCALRDVMDASLAVRRYLMANQAAPTSLDALVPKYLPVVPKDPYSGEPLRFVPRDDRIVLYSIGTDRIDNGGACDPAKWEPDIAVEVPIPAIQE